jgi:CRP/FNR family transcriptional regulator
LLSVSFEKSCFVIDLDQIMSAKMSIPNFAVDCAGCPIRHRAVCSLCEEDELAALEKIKFYKTYEAGQTIAIRGDDMSTVSSVVTGTASLTRTMEDGRMQMIGLLFPSDFIGRPGRTEYQYDVTAISETTLCCFKRRPFERLMAETPHLVERLMEMSLDELDVARDWMLLLGRKTAREKVASFLKMVSKRKTLHIVDGLKRVDLILPITREAMATYLGLTIETVSRQMAALRKDDIIAIDGQKHVVINDLDALIQEAGDDA